MTNKLKESTPPPVLSRATQGGEVRARWAWTAPEVWTERMLTALEDGVKGGRWFSLIVTHPRPRVHSGQEDRYAREAEVCIEITKFKPG